MNYTKAESDYIKKYLKRLEQDKRYWPLLRWFILLAAIASMGSAFFIFIKLQGFQDTLSSIFSMPKKEYNAESLRIFIEGNLMSQRMEFILLLKVTLQYLIGIVLLVYCLSNWNRHIKQGIMIKVIQKIISAEEQP